MAASTKQSLTALLSKAALDDHEQLLKASETALKASPTDAQAQRVKIVALLKLERYTEAVAFIEKRGAGLEDKLALEYSYGLYKTGQLKRAVEVASKAGGHSQRGLQHIEAQAQYRLEDYSRTAQLYADLQEAEVADEAFDLRVNQGAIDAQGQWLGSLATTKKPSREDLEAFETAYNAACGSIARGEFAQAEILLKRAKELCKYSEDLTDAQKAEELLPIVVQQLYTLYRQGKASEAEAIAQEIDIDKVDNIATKKIAANNLLLIQQDRQVNPFLAHKTFHSGPRIPESEHVFSYQSIPLTSNEKTIELQSFKFSGIINSTRRHLAKQNLPSIESDVLMASAFNAAAHAQVEVSKTAIQAVLPELERRPNDVGLVITLIQMYHLIGDTTTAIELVESLLKRLESAITPEEQDIRFHAGLVSVVVSLYRAQGRKTHIKHELARAASHWRQRPRPPINLLRAAGVSLLESPAADDLQTASEIFSKLYEETPEDKATIAGYVASNAVSDPKSVTLLAEKLSPVAKLISKIDIDTLENAGIPQSSNALAIASSAGAVGGRSSRKRGAAGDVDPDSGKQKRVRKSRLPKDYDPASNAKPDPERWLPMRDRSYYRAPKSKKKGRKGVDDRTQGGNVNEDLDINKSTSAAKGGEIVGGGGGGKKKKGKGKK